VRKHASDTGEFTSPLAVSGEPTDPRSCKATLKAFVQIQGQLPLFRHGVRWPKSWPASIASEGLAWGVRLPSALETGMVVKFTEGEDPAQREAAQGGLWVSQITSRDQARTNRVQGAQSTSKHSGLSWQTSELHRCVSTDVI